MLWEWKQQMSEFEELGFFLLSYINCFLDLTNAFSLKEKHKHHHIPPVPPNLTPTLPSEKRKEASYPSQDNLHKFHFPFMGSKFLAAPLEKKKKKLVLLL